MVCQPGRLAGAGAFLFAVQPFLRQLLFEQGMAFGPAATPDQIHGLGQSFQARFVEVRARMLGLKRR